MAYPFTDPAVSPCTMHFWKIRTSSTAGTVSKYAFMIHTVKGGA